jgi:hypothetical protein
MSTKQTNYLAKKIVWEQTTDPHHPFVAEFENEKCVIRLNNFPDKHLYTLIVNGEDVVEFDDWSAQWSRASKAKPISRATHNKSSAQTRRHSSNQRRVVKP